MVPVELQRLTTEIQVEPDPPVDERVPGAVRWFSPEKGYGFIAPDGGGDDVFVRHSSIDAPGFRRLEAGQRVTFERADDGRGPRALRVRPA